MLSLRKRSCRCENEVVVARRLLSLQKCCSRCTNSARQLKLRACCFTEFAAGTLPFQSETRRSPARAGDIPPLSPVRRADSARALPLGATWQALREARRYPAVIF